MAIVIPCLLFPLLMGAPQPPRVPRPDIRSGASMRRVDKREQVMQTFFRCVRGQRCNVGSTFMGAEAVRQWAGMKSKLMRRKVQFKSLSLVSRMPTSLQAKWQRRWGRTARRLVSKGFSKDLQRLGLGAAIVTARPDVAVALMHIKLTYRGRQEEVYLIVVLWHKHRRWRLAYWEDSPLDIRRFLLKHAP